MTDKYKVVDRMIFYEGAAVTPGQLPEGRADLICQMLNTAYARGHDDQLAKIERLVEACKRALRRLEWLGAEHNANGDTEIGSCPSCVAIRKALEAATTEPVK